MTLLLLGALVISASPADAQPKPDKPPTDVQTDRARQLHKEADELFKKGDYERARVAYLAAWALKKHWQIAASLGDCEVFLLRYRDAAEHLTFALREVPATSEWDSVRKDGTKLLAEAKTHVGAITLTVSAADADVSVDQTVVGKTPLLDPIFLEPGAHTIEVKKVGFIAKRVDVEAKAGSAQTRDVQLEAETSSGAGGAPPTTSSTGTGTAGAGGGTPDPPPSSGKSVPLIVSGALLGTIGIGVGAALLGLGASAASDRDEALAALPGSSPCGAGTPHTSACQGIVDDDDAFIALSAGGGVALGVGAALGIATLIYAVVPNGSAEKKSARFLIAPTISPTFHGVTAVGSF